MPRRPLPPPIVDLEDAERFELIGEVAEVIYIAKKKAETPLGHVTHEDFLRYGFEPKGDPLPYPIFLRRSVTVKKGDVVHIHGLTVPKWNGE